MSKSDTKSRLNRAAQQRRRRKLLTRAWQGRVGKCICPCPWANEVNLVCKDSEGPLCNLRGAIRGFPCQFEKRLFNDLKHDYERLYSDSTANLLSSIQVSVLRSEALGEGGKALQHKVRLAESSMAAELRARDILLRNEQAMKRLEIQEKRLQIEGSKNKPSNAQIIDLALQGKKGNA